MQMDTFPFHWDTLDAPQCPRMACHCPGECHESRGLLYLILNILVLRNLGFVKCPFSEFAFQDLDFVACSFAEFALPYMFMALWFCFLTICFSVFYCICFHSIPMTAPPPE